MEPLVALLLELGARAKVAEAAVVEREATIKELEAKIVELTPKVDKAPEKA